MNYYERHLGDYARDAGHLTMIEHGAYTILLDRYYTTETGIPADQAHRVARARTKEEKQAVDAVLNEFFTLLNGVWIKGRVEEEIARAMVKINAAKENGKKGGRPKQTKSGSESVTQEKPAGFPLGSESVTQTKAHQAPDTRLHIPNKAEAHNSESSDQPPGESAAPPPAYEQLANQLQKAGVSITSSHPNVIAWVGRGVTGKQAADAIAIARQRKPDGPIPANYLVPIIEEILNPPAASTAKTSGAWRFSDEATLAKGKELGIEPNVGEFMEPYRARLSVAIERRRVEA
jgi:uncharacterized protein YdaU (DUF1376 family)